MRQTRKIKKAIKEDDSERKITKMLSNAEEQLKLVKAKSTELDAEILEKLNQEHFDKYLRIHRRWQSHTLNLCHHYSCEGSH